MTSDVVKILGLGLFLLNTIVTQSTEMKQQQTKQQESVLEIISVLEIVV